MSKSNFLCRQSLTRIRIRIGLVPIEEKIWIRIRIETKADPKHDDTMKDLLAS
jgi:hypothetical protein